METPTGTALATQETGTLTVCATPFSTTSLAAAIPAWLGKDLVEPDRFELPDSLPEGAAVELRAAADRFSRSLAVPASHDERTAILGELRLRTKVRNENEEEARARFRLLRKDLSSVPVEILREATLNYAKTNRFFPDGAGEILPSIERIRMHRSRMAYRLKQLAREAEERLEEEQRLAADPLTPEAAAAIIEEFNLKPDTVERIKPPGPRRKPTVQDYIEMGVDRATVEQSLAGGAPSE